MTTASLPTHDALRRDSDALHPSDIPIQVSDSERRLSSLLDAILDYYVASTWRRMSDAMHDAVTQSCHALNHEQGYTDAYEALRDACSTLNDRSTAMRRAVKP